MAGRATSVAMRSSSDNRRPDLGRRSALRLLPVLVLLMAAACRQGGFAVATGEGGTTVTEPLIVHLALSGEDEERDIAVAAAMERLNVPSVSLAVIDGGQIAWTRTWGEGISTATPFQAGALSQPVAAATAMSLIEEGYLTLDDDVGAWVDQWSLAIPGHPVTLRNLMSMTAGFSDPGFQGYPAGALLPTLGQILAGAPPANSPALSVVSAPGTVFAVSDSGYVVLEAALQGATGVDFAELARARVLVPAGMVASSFEQPAGDTLAVIAATGHDGAGNPIPGGWHNNPERAARGLWSTPSDIAAFLIALGQALDDRGALLGDAGADQMVTRQNDGAWGLGLAVIGRGGDLALSRSGTTTGYAAAMLFLPERDQGAVVMTGGSNGTAIAQAILAGLGETYRWPGEAIPAD